MEGAGLTFLRRRDGDGLRRELLIEVARVRLRGDLRLEGRDELGGATFRITGSEIIQV